MKALSPVIGLVVSTFATGLGLAETFNSGSQDFEKFARALRESALLKLEPRVHLPTQAGPLSTSEKYPWKQNIVTTTFWVGESAAQNNPVHNFSSSWDVSWWRTYGGYDNPDPSARIADFKSGDFRAARFVPQLNPFYFALPYNDVTGGRHKPEASRVIPWFREAFTREGESVLKDRWICIKNRRLNRECYAQWGDCGPFRTDHHEYVFGNERPKPNLNKGAGLDVSPAVRDYLGIAGTDVVDWRFVEWREVPPGPWGRYGENNDLVQYARRRSRVASAAPVKSVQPAPRMAAPPPLPPPPGVSPTTGPRVDVR
jgi:hypothetical protein